MCRAWDDGYVNAENRTSSVQMDKSAYGIRIIRNISHHSHIQCLYDKQTDTQAKETV